jgi:hypothetical protein
VAGLPEGVVEVVLGGPRIAVEQFGDAVPQPERGRLPQRVDPGAVGEE